VCGAARGEAEKQRSGLLRAEKSLLQMVSFSFLRVSLIGNDQFLPRTSKGKDSLHGSCV
jgi:hypothetical protein